MITVALPAWIDSPSPTIDLAMLQNSYKPAYVAMAPPSIDYLAEAFLVQDNLARKIGHEVSVIRARMEAALAHDEISRVGDVFNLRPKRAMRAVGVVVGSARADLKFVIDDDVDYDVLNEL